MCYSDRFYTKIYALQPTAAELARSFPPPGHVAQLPLPNKTAPCRAHRPPTSACPGMGVPLLPGEGAFRTEVCVSILRVFILVPSCLVPPLAPSLVETRV